MRVEGEVIRDDSQADVDERLQRLAAVVAGYKRESTFNQLRFFQPNKAQQEFFDLTGRYDEILWSAANRIGKTKGVSALIAYCTMGIYPDWWTGIRFETPVNCLIIGLTFKQIRGSSQRLLFNEHERGFGTGMIPAHVILEKKYMKDENECIDFVRIKHVSGMESTIKFFTQNMAWENMMGSEYQICWADEQLGDTKYYSQLIRATASLRKKIIILSATPELGRTKIFDRFEKDNRPYCVLKKSTLWDATQYTPDHQQRIFDGYAEWERPFRVYGEPVAGSGLVYNIDERRVRCPRFDIPREWRRIAGIDFGRVRSKTSVVFLAFNPYAQERTYYLYDSFWIRGVGPQEVMPYIQQRYREAGFRIPIAYFRDGNLTEQSTGNRVAKVYEDLGANMLPEAAYLSGQDGKKTTSVRAGCLEIEFLMNAGRFLIFDIPQCEPLFQELRIYCKDENGDIPKDFSNDPHHLDAMRYAWSMADRYAESGEELRNMQYAETADINYNVFDAINPARAVEPWSIFGEEAYGRAQSKAYAPTAGYPIQG